MLEIPMEDYRAIRTSPDMKAALEDEARAIAAQADALAGVPGGYATELTVGTDRARANVWPEKPKAVRAEIKTAPLLQVVGRLR